VSQPSQIPVIVGTITATLLGVIVTFIFTSYLQSRQAKTDACIRREHFLSELLAAAVDLLIAAKALREAHARRTTWRYLLSRHRDAHARLP
jgi:hypothetical protein